jgi:hypothetical protein
MVLATAQIEIILYFYTNEVFNMRIIVKSYNFIDMFEKVSNFIKENKGII